jgi:subtilase family serine protease
MRGLPDVAWSADGFGASIAFALGGLGATTGTSAPTAEWAGIVALIDQVSEERIGSLNPFLYRVGRSSAYHTVMHDITSGDSSFAGFAGFSAGPGWDAVTGLGSPDVAKLVGRIGGEDHHGEGGASGGGSDGSDGSGGGGSSDSGGGGND